MRNACPLYHFWRAIFAISHPVISPIEVCLFYISFLQVRKYAAQFDGYLERSQLAWHAAGPSSLVICTLLFFMVSVHPCVMCFIVSSSRERKRASKRVLVPTQRAWTGMGTSATSTKVTLPMEPVDPRQQVRVEVEPTFLVPLSTIQLANAQDLPVSTTQGPAPDPRQVRLKSRTEVRLLSSPVRSSIPPSLKM